MKEELLQKIESIAPEALSLFESATSEESLYGAKVEFLGKKGKLTDILKMLGGLSAEDRPIVGARANEIRQKIEQAYSTKSESLKGVTLQKKVNATEDVTLPGLPFSVGSTHPVTQVLAEMKSIFLQMGFDVFEGPEVETDYYNFEALNIPSNHPARDMQDTFYVNSKDAKGNFKLLRTHTSPVQVHVMEQYKPPIQMIAPGVVYRRDSDVSHTPMFHQVEGLVVDKGIHCGHLKGVLEHFLQKLFKKDLKVKFRPSYFPFTEPSFEVDIQCVFCGGTGTLVSAQPCRVCKKTGWLEVMGCGMVDPEVFKFAKINSEIFTGFAFGVGIERIAMLQYGINDIRLFFENDLRFLEQF